jgi:hypothetical protein
MFGKGDNIIPFSVFSPEYVNSQRLLWTYNGPIGVEVPLLVCLSISFKSYQFSFRSNSAFYVEHLTDNLKFFIKILPVPKII